MQPIYENMESFFRVLLGTYTPVTYSVGGETIIPAGLAGVDWPYLIRAGVFILVVYCIFRLVGAVLCK